MVVVVVGLIVGVALELLLSKRQHARNADPPRVESELIRPQSDQVPGPRFVDDGEGFRVIGPVAYDDPGAAPWEADDSLGPEGTD